jgi:hypothetical protein
MQSFTRDSQPRARISQGGLKVIVVNIAASQSRFPQGVAPSLHPVAQMISEFALRYASMQDKLRQNKPTQRHADSPTGVNR